MSDAAAIARAHRTLTDSAAASKRAIAVNRRQLRDQLQAIELLEAEATRLGLRLTVKTTQPKGGHSE